MTAEAITAALRDAIHDALDRFAPNELAYLALTGKVENNVRDRVAWELNLKLEDRVVARESRRRDLVVLERALDWSPVALLEAKALYSFDLVWKAEFFVDLVRKDIDKARDERWKDKLAEVFVLLIITHVDDDPKAPPHVV